MPRRQAEVEQGDDLYGLQQVDSMEGEVFAATEFAEVLLAPGQELLCRPLAVGKVGKVGSAVSQVGGSLPCLALQHGERDSLAFDDNAETRVRRVSSGEAD